MMLRTLLAKDIHEQIQRVFGLKVFETVISGSLAQLEAWVAADANETNLAPLLDLAQGGQGLVHDLLHVHKFDVVAQHDVEAISSQPMR